MRGKFVTVSLLFLQVTTACVLAQSGESAATLISPSALSLRGVIVDAAGVPLPGVRVELRQQGTESPYKTTSGSDGAYVMSGISPTGGLLISYTKETCITVVRKLKDPKELLSIKSLDITIICCDPSASKIPHNQAPALPAQHYVGGYQVQKACIGKPVQEVSLDLTNESGRGPGSCDCKGEWKLAVLDSKPYACWRVKDNGDLEVNFQCGTVAMFAGTQWIMWVEGNSLIGQTYSWSDCGCAPPICNLKLTKSIEK